ncbi:hypothetical protein HZH66_014049 [Vespula vulgaris]|uniref:Uncharacterized protein n=1 Tax=Vespula vulgaris TaxID=7454 RepID=A0A834J521_VESVU|nr:hypothetical protein HZH66_014049 [Vespula vulgaris]
MSSLSHIPLRSIALSSLANTICRCLSKRNASMEWYHRLLGGSKDAIDGLKLSRQRIYVYVSPQHRGFDNSNKEKHNKYIESRISMRIIEIVSNSNSNSNSNSSSSSSSSSSSRSNTDTITSISSSGKTIWEIQL